MKNIKKTQLVILAIFIVNTSCHKSNDISPSLPKDPSYFVVNNNPPFVGNISTVDLQGTATSLFSSGSSYADVIVSGDQLFCITIDNQLLIYDLIQSKLTKTISLGRSTGNYRKHIGYSNGQVFVSDWGYPGIYASLNYDTFIKSIDLTTNKTDSIYVGTNGTIGCIASANGKIFVASSDDRLNKILLSYDAISHAVVNRDTLDGHILDMMVDKSNKFVCLYWI